MARQGIRDGAGSAARLHQDRLSGRVRSDLLLNLLDRSGGSRGRSRCENVDRLLDGIDGALGGARAMRDQIAGAVEIEPADLADPGRDQQVGWIAGQARPGDAVLHDVEGIDHAGGDARSLAAAEKLALHGPLGREEFAEAAFRPGWLDLGVGREADRYLRRRAVRVDRRAVGEYVA